MEALNEKKDFKTMKEETEFVMSTIIFEIHRCGLSFKQRLDLRTNIREMIEQDIQSYLKHFEKEMKEEEEKENKSL